jgi:ABC-type phosphate/phosphonate transport system substrate-binding protein
MIASLPMYDFPEVREATDAVWAAIAERLGSGSTLERRLHHSDVWRRDDLLFSQSCGYPFTHEFRGVLTYVATPHYDVEGCEGPKYSSVLLARHAKPVAAFDGCVAAINAVDSMSGMLALRLCVRPSKEVLSGGHFASMEKVRSGVADICAVDCVTYALARHYRPQAVEELVEVARSPMVPGLPYVTRSGDVGDLRAALKSVFADPALAVHRKALMLSGVSVLDADAYEVIAALERG